MKDTEITKKFGIPRGTLNGWKNSNDYRRNLYHLIKNLDKIIDCEEKDTELEEYRKLIKSKE